MQSSTLTPINGVIQSISPLENDCCSRLITLSTTDGPVNIALTSTTYVVQESRLRAGMTVTAFYDPNLPVPLVFPPRYQAVILTRRNPREMVTVAFFDDNLIATDGSLALNIGPSTEILSSNGQPFTCDPGGQYLIVYYTTTTRSIPPQTTPRRIIVMC